MCTQTLFNSLLFKTIYKSIFLKLKKESIKINQNQNQTPPYTLHFSHYCITQRHFTVHDTMRQKIVLYMAIIYRI